MTLLDTHALLWLVTGASSLGSKARLLADEALARGELSIASMSWWEIGMLVQKGRIHLAQEPTALRNSLVRTGLVELTLDGNIGIVSAFLDTFHGDPADRIIVATGLVHGSVPYSVLVTADQKILSWEGGLVTKDARL